MKRSTHNQKPFQPEPVIKNIWLHYTKAVLNILFLSLKGAKHSYQHTQPQILSSQLLVWGHHNWTFAIKLKRTMNIKITLSVMSSQILLDLIQGNIQCLYYSVFHIQNYYTHSAVLYIILYNAIYNRAATTNCYKWCLMRLKGVALWPLFFHFIFLYNNMTSLSMLQHTKELIKTDNEDNFHYFHKCLNLKPF